MDVTDTPIFQTISGIDPHAARVLYAYNQSFPVEERPVKWEAQDLSGAFVWSNAPFGHSYWANISCRLNEWIYDEFDDDEEWEEEWE